MTLRALVLCAAVAAVGGCAFPERQAASRPSPVHASLSVDVHDARVTNDTAGIGFIGPNRQMLAADFTVQPREGSGLGFGARVIAGSGAPLVLEGGVLLGSRAFAVEVGGGTRSFVDPDDPEEPFGLVYPLARVGVRSRANLGRSAFSVQFRAATSLGLFLEADQDIGSPGAGGWVGESTLSWTRPGSALTLNLGYRIERFEGYHYRQELSSLSLGGGVLFGRR